MSIKSEKAKEYIAKNRVSPRIGEDNKIDGFIRIGDGSFMYADSAQKAVEIAESDARERAARAFKKNCQNPPGHNPTECKLCVWWVGRECALFNQFLKNYDNE